MILITRACFFHFNLSSLKAYCSFTVDTFLIFPPLACLLIKICHKAEFYPKITNSGVWV